MNSLTCINIAYCFQGNKEEDAGDFLLALFIGSLQIVTENRKLTKHCLKIKMKVHCSVKKIKGLLKFIVYIAEPSFVLLLK